MASMLPLPPPIPELRATGVLPDEVIEWQPGEIAWRAHRTTGDHVLPWNALREFGPILRFDHHPTPRDDHPGYGIWYGAASPRGALAEAFQSARVIDRHRGDPYLTGVRFTRSLRLFDVSGIGGGAWDVRDLDGIIYRGRFAGSTSVAIVERAAGAFMQRPVLSLPLSHPGLADAVETAAHQLGYTIT